MKDKIISWIIWAIICWLVIYWYNYYFNTNMSNSKTSNWFSRWNFDPSNMSDAQLERMATRAWITPEVLKSRIASWEKLSDIIPMWNRWTWSWMRSWSWNRMRGWNGTWSWNVQ